MHNEMRELALKMARILDKKGALDIEILEVTHLTSITDYFLIASGRNIQAVRLAFRGSRGQARRGADFPGAGATVCTNPAGSFWISAA